MRYIKLLLISGVVLFIVLTLLSLVFPSHLRISRAINVAVPRQKVYATISDLRTWDNWNEFVRSTPLTGKSVTQPYTGAGATIHSDQLDIIESFSSPDSIVVDFKQANGKQFTGGFHLLQLSPDSLTVQWWFDFHFSWYPWEKLGILVYDKKMGPVMEESLSGLKKLVETP